MLARDRTCPRVNKSRHCNLDHFLLTLAQTSSITRSLQLLHHVHLNSTLYRSTHIQPVIVGTPRAHNRLYYCPTGGESPRLSRHRYPTSTENTVSILVDIHPSFLVCILVSQWRTTSSLTTPTFPQAAELRAPTLIMTEVATEPLLFKLYVLLQSLSYLNFTIANSMARLANRRYR